MTATIYPINRYHNTSLFTYRLTEIKRMIMLGYNRRKICDELGLSISILRYVMIKGKIAFPSRNIYKPRLLNTNQVINKILKIRGT